MTSQAFGLVCERLPSVIQSYQRPLKRLQKLRGNRADPFGLKIFPLIIPSRLWCFPNPSTDTFISLHGSDSDGATFGPGLLDNTVSAYTERKLPDAFSHAKFVFSIAFLHQTTIHQKSLTTQPSSKWSLTACLERQDFQMDGTRKSATFIHYLLREVADLVESGNVVLGGLNQTCAAILISLLT